MIKQVLLANLQKLNRARKDSSKLKLATESGFDTVVAYRDFLLTELGEDAPHGEKPSTASAPKIIRNVHILDISGSMQGPKLDRALEGINMEMDGLKKLDEGIEYLQTVVTFHSSGTQKYLIDNVPIKDAKHIRCRAQNYTALNETIGKVLTKLSEDKAYKDCKTLIKIFTDGGENDSTGKFRTYQAVSKLIGICEDLGFTVTFVGTDRDVKNVIQKLKIDISNTLIHDNTSEGVEAAYGQTVNSTMSYSKDVVAGKPVRKGFYKKLK